jgi:4-hydroxybenzoyl-CoA thioesterase
MNSNKRVIRIEWGDCDPAGIIFNARYFEIFDASTAALFERALGITKHQMLKRYNSAGIPLVRTEARFLKPAHFGDDITVQSRLITFGRSSFQVEHRVSLTGDICGEGVVRDPSGRLKSSPIPAAVLEKFANSRAELATTT